MELFIKTLFICLALALTNGAPPPNGAVPGAEPLRKTHCEFSRDGVRTTSPGGLPLIGAFVPQCDANGQYSPRQCHASTGHCWCVDSKGQEKAGTKTPPGTPPVECAKPAEPLRKTHCEFSRDGVRTTSPGGLPLIGAFVPQCDANGQYSPRQCHASTGHCWCVDSKGQEKAGTKTPPGTPSVECPQLAEPLRKTHCEFSRDGVRTTSPGGLPMIGAFVPQCDANGQYSPRQCHASTGHCWCVDSKGQEKAGTKTPPGTPPVECAKPDAAAAGLDRCEGIEFDAVTPDERGVVLFFKGDHLWEGFHGSAHLSNGSFRELDDFHHVGHVDAAFRMHNTEKTGDHDHIYFFLDNKVFRYFKKNLERGYPKEIQEDFPGVPANLDAAMECPKGECVTNSVLFFKGHDVHVFDIATRIVKTKTWSNLPVCTSALRWLEHYYCFHGHNFTKFNPVSGEVNPGYPKDIRNYFLSCAGFGHGGDRRVPKCSEVKLDAITTDDTGKTYFFAGLEYMRLDTHRDGLHGFPITRSWKEVTNGVDAVFSYTDKIYMIKDDQVYIYKQAAHYTLIEGYPKTVKEELGVEGRVDAAFVCPNEHTLYVIQGQSLRQVDLTATPRTVSQPLPLPLSGIDASLCSTKGVNLFKGSEFYHYESPSTLALSRIAPFPQKITSAMMGCKD